jgi:hypothetical protein
VCPFYPTTKSHCHDRPLAVWNALLHAARAGRLARGRASGDGGRGRAGRGCQEARRGSFPQEDHRGLPAGARGVLRRDRASALLRRSVSPPASPALRQQVLTCRSARRLAHSHCVAGCRRRLATCCMRTEVHATLGSPQRSGSQGRRYYSGRKPWPRPTHALRWTLPGPRGIYG